MLSNIQSVLWTDPDYFFQSGPLVIPTNSQLVKLKFCSSIVPNSPVLCCSSIALPSSGTATYGEAVHQRHRQSALRDSEGGRLFIRDHLVRTSRQTRPIWRDEHVVSRNTQACHSLHRQSVQV